MMITKVSNFLFNKNNYIEITLNFKNITITK